LLNWNAPAGAVSGYRVYYGTASGRYLQTPGSGIYSATNSFTQNGLASGTTYYFAVTAVSPAGVETAFSNEASKLVP
jgi:fibronectin type 3 domain-containing protein